VTQPTGNSGHRHGSVFLGRSARPAGQTANGGPGWQLSLAPGPVRLARSPAPRRRCNGATGSSRWPASGRTITPGCLPSSRRASA